MHFTSFGLRQQNFSFEEIERNSVHCTLSMIDLCFFFENSLSEVFCSILIEITFVKKNIFLDPFSCNFIRPKTSDKLSVNIDHL